MWRRRSNCIAWLPPENEMLRSEQCSGSLVALVAALARYVNAANSHLVPELSAMAYAGRHSTFSQKAICRERYCTFGKFRRAAPKGVRDFGGFPSLQAGAEASCVSLLEPL